MMSLLRIKNINGIENMYLPLDEHKDKKGVFIKYNKNGTRTYKTVEEINKEFNNKEFNNKYFK